MTQNIHELCCTLVEEFYGPFHGQLFSKLTYHGRLSAGDLAQNCRLPVKHVRRGLAALVQSRLVYHHTLADGPSTYQANVTSTYNLLRIGRLVEIVRAQYDGIAVTVISEAIKVGFSTTAELESRVLEVLLKEPTPLIPAEYEKWVQKSLSDQSQQIQSSIKALLEDGFLSHVRTAHMQSEFDRREDAHLYLKRNGLLPVTKGKKGVIEQEQRIDEEVRRRVDSKVAERGYVPVESSERKRNLDETDSQQGSKKPKYNGDTNGGVNGHAGRGSRSWKDDQASLIFVTFDNVIRDIRNDHLAGKAQKSIGELCGRVLTGALLQVPSTNKTRTYPDSTSLDLGQLRDDLNHSIEARHSNGVTSNGTPRTNGNNAHFDSNHDSDRLTYNEVERALGLLAGSKFDFLRTTSGAYGREWSIMKSEVDRFVLEDEILRLMGDRLAPPSLRIVRMLIDKGKLDEKTLQEIGLLAAKDLRTTLAQLKQLGFIDLQEIPRESQRQPNRTIFLWFYDSDRVRKVLLNNLYKAMTRLLQRYQTERAKLATTIEKAERNDEQGGERQFLAAAENTVFERWQRTEKWLLGEISRLDESVAMLRDL